MNYNLMKVVMVAGTEKWNIFKMPEMKEQDTHD